MKTLLLVIDFINDIVHPDGKRSATAAYVAEYEVMQQANKTIAIARQKNIPIVHVKVGFSANYIECPSNSPLFSKAKQDNALQLGTWGTEFHQQMDVREKDTIIIKHRVSALYATPLESILRANQIDTVIVSGVSTNMAVTTVTRELHDRDYKVIVVKNACGAATLEAHQATLNALSRIATTCDVNELNQLLH